MIIKTPYGTFDTKGSRMVVKVFDYERKKVYEPLSPIDPACPADYRSYPRKCESRDIALPTYFYSEVYDIDREQDRFLIYDPGDGKEGSGKFRYIYFGAELYKNTGYYSTETISRVQIVREQE